MNEVNRSIRMTLAEVRRILAELSRRMEGIETALEAMEAAEVRADMVTSSIEQLSRQVDGI